MAYGTANVDVIQSSTAGTPVQFNDGNGTQVGTLCRAWVNFNGTGTVAIRASFNVSSITDNGTGDYTVNFTTAMPDINYSTVSSSGRNATGSGGYLSLVSDRLAQTTTAVQMATINVAGTATDTPYISVAVFR